MKRDELIGHAVSSFAESRFLDQHRSVQQPPVAAGTTDRRVLVIVVFRLPSSAIEKRQKIVLPSVPCPIREDGDKFRLSIVPSTWNTKEETTSTFDKKTDNTIL